MIFFVIMIKIFAFFLMVNECYGVIYRLNGTEYSRMPPVFHLDDYEQCLLNPKGIYCTADIDLVSDTHNELFTMIQNYSEYSKKHYNHSQIHHGICITQTCKKYYIQNTTEDLRSILEKCLNESLWKNYELKCNISNSLICNHHKQNMILDKGDIAIGVIIVVLVLLNIVGSVYDIMLLKRKNKGNRFLLSFSTPNNLKRLISSYRNLEEREERLKCFHGLRTMTILCVIYCHSMLIFAHGPQNPQYVEMLYDNIGHFIFLNGTIVVQTFFIISGCLLSYKLEIYAEKHKIKWTLLPKAITMTWIKLTPTYAIILGITCTWLRHAGSGPFWEVAVVNEVEDCRSNFWANLLYINNYIDDTQCMVQTWFLGATMQLCILGYAVCILVKSGKCRQVVLTFLFIMGILIPAAHTYFQNLDAVLIVTPETARTFKSNPTFNNVYTRGHTNIVNFVMGIALGFFIYRLQYDKVDMNKYKKYNLLFALVPLAVLGSMFLGSIFYRDGFVAPILLRSAYSGLLKPIFGLIISIVIISNVFKLQNIHRGVMESKIWKIPSKLSYCAYLNHILIIRMVNGNTTTLTPVNNFIMVQLAITFIVLSFIIALPLWLLVDAPVTEFSKTLLFYKKDKNPESTMENGETLKTVQNIVNEERK